MWLVLWLALADASVATPDWTDKCGTLQPGEMRAGERWIFGFFSRPREREALVARPSGSRPDDPWQMWLYHYGGHNARGEVWDQKRLVGKGCGPIRMLVIKSEGPNFVLFNDCKELDKTQVMSLAGGQPRISQDVKVTLTPERKPEVRCRRSELP